MITQTAPSIDTRAVHAGEPEPRIGGAVAMPIFQSATYLYEGETDYHASQKIRRLPSSRPRLKVVKANVEEISRHEEKLDKIDKASGGSVWRKLELHYD